MGGRSRKKRETRRAAICSLNKQVVCNRNLPIHVKRIGHDKVKTAVWSWVFGGLGRRI
jgi:hypothetical protein